MKFILPDIRLSKKRLMKMYFLSFLFLFWGNGAFPGDSILTSPDIDDIAGPVKSVRFEESWYEDRDGVAVLAQRYLSSICHYEKNGILKERLFYDGNGITSSRWMRELDTRGRVIREAKYKGENQLITQVEFRYGETGNCTETLMYRYDGVLEKQLSHQYNEKNQRVESSEQVNQVLKRKKVFIYDEKGNIFTQSDIDTEGKLEVKEEFYYDPRGDLFQTNLYNKDNELMATMTYLRDEAGRTIEVLAHTQGNRLDMRKLYGYDSHGNLADLTTFGRDGKFMNRELYEYDYDDHGNWMQKKESTARLNSTFEHPDRVIYRTITYYDEESSE